MNNTTATNASSPPDEDQENYHFVLVTIYSVVLLCGTSSIVLMFRTMKCRASSTTSIIVVYLIIAHLTFLLSVPFRIYYYSSGNWMLGLPWCKVISSLIHIHMYTCFLFYVIIIVTRLKLFYRNSETLTSHSRFIPVLIGVTLSVTVFIIVIIIIWFSYGTNTAFRDKSNENQKCFQFGNSINDGVKVFNYIISMLVIAVSLVLTVLQANVLRILNQKNGPRGMQQLDYGVQQMSLLFAYIMMICFVPYHIFRLHYLENLQLENINEVFLSLTTFNCMDLLTILAGRSCKKCFP